MVRRNDGVAAYNLAVVVDDAASGVDQVVRGDDLLPAAINQAYLATRARRPATHLRARAAGGQRRRRRLAKRDGAVTLADLAARGVAGARRARPDRATRSVCRPSGSVAELLPHFDPQRLPDTPGVDPLNF